MTEEQFQQLLYAVQETNTRLYPMSYISGDMNNLGYRVDAAIAAAQLNAALSAVLIGVLLACFIGFLLWSCLR